MSNNKIKENTTIVDKMRCFCCPDYVIPYRNRKEKIHNTKNGKGKISALMSKAKK